MDEVTVFHSYGGDVEEPPPDPEPNTKVPHLVVQAGLASASGMGADAETDSGVD